MRTTLYFLPPISYSDRSATTGSTDAARRAGSALATRPASARVAIAATNTRASVGSTWNRNASTVTTQRAVRRFKKAKISDRLGCVNAPRCQATVERQVALRCSVPPCEGLLRHLRPLRLPLPPSPLPPFPLHAGYRRALPTTSALTTFGAPISAKPIVQFRTDSPPSRSSRPPTAKDPSEAAPKPAIE